MQFAKLEWFECLAKVGELPPVIATEKPGAFTPAGGPSQAPVTSGQLPERNRVEMLALRKHSDPQQRWWRPNGLPLAETFDTHVFGQLDHGEPFGRWMILRFANAFPANANLQLQFSVPTSEVNYYSEVRKGNEPFPVFVSFPTNPETISLRVGEAAGDWRPVAEYVYHDEQAGHEI